MVWGWSGDDHVVNRVARANADVVLTKDDIQYPAVFVFDAR